MEAFPLLLAPYAPHLAEELWTVRLGHKESLTYAPWPTLDESLLVLDTINLPVQVRKEGKGGLTWRMNEKTEGGLGSCGLCAWGTSRA